MHLMHTAKLMHDPYFGESKLLSDNKYALEKITIFDPVKSSDSMESSACDLTTDTVLNNSKRLYRGSKNCGGPGDSEGRV